MSAKNAGLPEEVNSVGERLEEWRNGRRPGERIPEGLWKQAAKLARRHGLNCISRALKLDYYSLKRRAELNVKKAKSPRADNAVFVEMSPPEKPGSHACVVELEKSNGVKLRVSVRDAAAVDWPHVSEVFLGA
jgi:hypothetical protein